MFTAWIDESQSNARLDPGTYMLSAAIIEDSAVDVARAAMRTLLLPGQRKVHWRDEGRHELIVTTIAGLDVEHLVAVRCAPEAAARPERQRRLCLDRLLPELVALGVTSAILESRGRKDDQRDIDALNFIRRRRLIDGDLRIDHVGGPADPLLWIPDACCGAVTQYRCGNSTHFDQLRPTLTFIDVDG
ncbi:hypothetical protein [Gordonia humi]|uniref:DUF3800 domain-containing protein n=1 Tax=Gordonia humi TaxID=686429 RepID=A0A840F5Y6_9ACTN|nr:hypothetical protein [Gordonia humi]MBB4138074.1 hypothetical protein [Gordonia humi]